MSGLGHLTIPEETLKFTNSKQRARMGARDWLINHRRHQARAGLATPIPTTGLSLLDEWRERVWLRFSRVQIFMYHVPCLCIKPDK